jgi:hypothetical protein
MLIYQFTSDDQVKFVFHGGTNITDLFTNLQVMIKSNLSFMEVQILLIYKFYYQYIISFFFYF